VTVQSLYLPSAHSYSTKQAYKHCLKDILFHGVATNAGSAVSYQEPPLLWVIGLLGVFSPEMALLLQQVLLVPLPSKQAIALLMREDACR